MDQGHFSPESQHYRPTHHSGQLKTHGASVGLLPFSDKNNNWLICTRIVELGLDTLL